MTTTSVVEQEALIDGLLSLSRVLVGQTARSLAQMHVDVSLPQYRMMVVLASRGQQRTADLARELVVQPSTVTRKVDRLIARGLVWRGHRPEDRRVSWLGLTEAGKELVGASMRRRREEAALLLSRVEIADPGVVAAALCTLVTAAGEVPDPLWWERLAVSAGEAPGS